jgi:hypothetical protein
VDVSTSNMEHRLATTSQFIRTVGTADGSGAPSGGSAETDQAGSVYDTLPDAGALALAAGSSIKTGAGESLKASAGGPPMLRNLSALRSSASNLFRGMVSHTSTAAKALTQALSKASPFRRYRAPQALSSRLGLEQAVADYFQFMDRSGQRLLEDLALSAGQHAPHVQVYSSMCTFPIR